VRVGGLAGPHTVVLAREKAVLVSVRQRRRVSQWGPPLLLISPSLILVGVFVYGL